MNGAEASGEAEVKLRSTDEVAKAEVIVAEVDGGAAATSAAADMAKKAGITVARESAHRQAAGKLSRGQLRQVRLLLRLEWGKVGRDSGDSQSSRLTLERLGETGNPLGRQW